MNQQYIQKLKLNDLQQRLNPFIKKTPYEGKDHKNLKKIIEILQPRLVKLSEIEGRLSLFFENNLEPSSTEVLKVLREENSKKILSNKMLLYFFSSSFNIFISPFKTDK